MIENIEEEELRSADPYYGVDAQTSKGGIPDPPAPHRTVPSRLPLPSDASVDIPMQDMHRS